MPIPTAPLSGDGLCPWFTSLLQQPYPNGRYASGIVENQLRANYVLFVTVKISISY